MREDRKEGYLRLLDRDFSREEVEDYASRRYLHLDQRIVHLLEAKAIKKWIENSGPVQSVLDVPCGYGRLRECLPEGCKVTGVDLSFSMLQLARSRYTSVVRATVWRLPFKSESFDLSLSVRLFHHREIWERAWEAFSELSRVTRKFLIVSLYQRSSLHQLWRKFKGSGNICFVSHEEVISIAERCGLSLIGKKKILPIFHAQTLYWFKKVSV